MAAGGDNVDLITVEFTWNGIQRTCQMPPELFQMINDPSCDPAVKESCYQELFQKDNITPGLMKESKDEFAEADASNEAECPNVVEKVQPSFVYYGLNCSVNDEKNLNIYCGKTLDDLLQVILQLPSHGLPPVHPLDVFQKSYHHFPYVLPMDLIVMNACKLDQIHF